MKKTVLLTGGNLGNVVGNIAKAAQEVEQRIGHIVATSQVMSSQAWGFESDDIFLNQVLVVETELDPEEVLDKCLQIETDMGRVRDNNNTGNGNTSNHCNKDTNGISKGKAYQSRIMDVDILFYGNEIIKTDRLIVPHPLIIQREFVLKPLVDVMPDFVHPRLGKSMTELLKELG